MLEEIRNEREMPESAASRARGDLGRPIGGSTPFVQTERADLPILASGEQARIGAVDLRAARDAVAELGARGSAPLEALTVPETIALLDAMVGLEGALESLRARAVVHLEDAVKTECLRREASPRQAAAIARSETARVLKRSRSVAGRTLATSRRLVRSMPGILTGLSGARVVPQAAHKVGSVLAPATPELRRQVDEMLTSRLDELEGCGPQEWGDEAAKILHALDPQGAAARHQAAKNDRHVTIRRTDHGMAQVTALISGIDGARIRKGLSVAAESARAQGDRRGHQQIMADLFADALIGRGDGVDPTTLDVGIVITDRSLLAPSHADAALVEGFGAVPYDHAREEMLRAAQSEDDTDLALTLRSLYVDAERGDLVGVESVARAFPSSLRRFLMIAHQSCRAPFCDASIRQMDHIAPWARGGPTSLENGNGLCGGDNQKELSGERAEVVRDENGRRQSVRWTTRYGQTASRGAINLDPVGTYRRRRAAEERERAAVPNGRAAEERARAAVPNGRAAEERERAAVQNGRAAEEDRRAMDGTERAEKESRRPAAVHVSPADLSVAASDGMTVQRALQELRIGLEDMPPPHRAGRRGEHPGDWIVRRGRRGR